MLLSDYSRTIVYLEYSKRLASFRPSTLIAHTSLTDFFHKNQFIRFKFYAMELLLQNISAPESSL